MPKLRKTRYLLKRGETFHAIMEIPIPFRARFDKRRFMATLDTDSASVALSRAAKHVAAWKEEIAQAKGEPTQDTAYWKKQAARAAKKAKGSPAHLRLLLRTAANEEARQRILEQIGDAAYEVGMVNVERIGDNPSANSEARRFYAEATGARVSTKEHLDEWIGSLQVKEKTANMRRATIARLAAKFPMVDKVTRPEVRRWATELQATLSSATIQRLMSDCRTYWAYLATIQVVPDESTPFNGLGLKVKYASWLPYSPAEALRLLKGAEGDEKLANLIRLSMYSGARREELCALRVEHITAKADRFNIIDAKTEAGIRTVPVHSKLSKTVKRLAKASKDGYLLSGLKANANGDRGDAIGKRFTRLKQSLGFDERHSFHSWRGTVITLLERAGVPEGTVQDIVGHERSTLTGSTYSGKSTFEMRKAALAKLRY
jgi:integrase